MAKQPQNQKPENKPVVITHVVFKLEDVNFMLSVLSNLRAGDVFPVLSMLETRTKEAYAEQKIKADAAK